MIKDICNEPDLCTGCSACVNICPVQCISMKSDEDGFLYPKIDSNICIECQICKKTCPVNNPPHKESVKAAYIARYKDVPIVLNSTSGGMFTAFSKFIFEKNGIVCGVYLDENLKARHICINKSQIDILDKMRGSKYVQSDIGLVFSEIKRFLEEGRYVCFTGTPCQVLGLKSFLKKEYFNLITIDFVCRGVSSPYLVEQYFKYQEEKNRSKIKYIRFRNKTYGYHSGTMRIDFENGKKYLKSRRVDYLLTAFFEGACSRYSCYNCPAKGNDRCSDFTIFEAWHMQEFVPHIKDDDCGYTSVFARSGKSLQIFKDISPYIDYWNADPIKMKELDGIMIENYPEMHKSRATIIQEVRRSGNFEKTMNQYFKFSLKDNTVENLKKYVYSNKILKKCINIYKLYR